MIREKELKEKSKYTGITGSELANILNSRSELSREESKNSILSHIAFGSNKK